MIKPKHDSRNLPSASSSFRSVVPADFVDREQEYYRSVAYGGTAFYSPKHGKYCFGAGVSPQLNAGSAIPSGSAMPIYALDAYLVADAYGINPHIFAEGQAEISMKISRDEYKYFDTCKVENCDNLQFPGEQFCAKHTTLPWARDDDSDMSLPE